MPWVEGYRGTYIKVKGIRIKEGDNSEERYYNNDSVLKDGVRYNMANKRFYELISRVDVSITMGNNNEMNVIDEEGGEYVFYVVYKVWRNRNIVLEYKKNMLEIEGLWRMIHNMGKREYLESIEGVMVQDGLSDLEMDSFKKEIMDYTNNVKGGVDKDDLYNTLMLKYKENESNIKDFVLRIINIVLMLSDTDYDYNYTIDELCNVDLQESLKTVVKGGEIKETNVEELYTNFMNKYYKRVHKNMEGIDKNQDLQEIVNKRINLQILKEFYLLNYNNINQIDNELCSVINSLLIKKDEYNVDVYNDVINKIISRLNLDVKYFMYVANNYIIYNNNVYEIKMLQDQFLLGEYSDIYTGNKFSEAFINNIASKQIEPSKDIELYVNDENSEIIDDTINKFIAFINSKITEKKYNSYSSKFFVDDEEPIQTNNENVNIEERVEVIKEFDTPKREVLQEVDVNKLKTVKYNKNKRIYEIITYESVSNFDNDGEWNKPRISRNNEIKSS